MWGVGRIIWKYVVFVALEIIANSSYALGNWGNYSQQ
jgi:hypothetical protein